MNTMLKAALSGLFFVCSFFTIAGDELDIINATVETTAAQIEQEHGVLLTGQERNNLKISLIADKISKEQKDLAVQQMTDTAIQVYEITDPVDQRQLLIEIQAAQTNLVGGGGGDDP